MSSLQFPNLVCVHIDLWGYRVAGIAPEGNVIGAMMSNSVLEHFLSKAGSYGGPGLILDDISECAGLWSVEHLGAGREALKDGLKALGILEPAFCVIGCWRSDELIFGSWWPKAGLDLSHHFGTDISIDVFKRRADAALAKLSPKLQAAAAMIQKMGEEP